MRTVTFGMNISLDGYCDHTMATPTSELMDYFTAMMDDVDLLFFGRVMYQLMFPYWEEVAKNRSGSDAENRFASKLVSIDRVVMSTTLESPDDKTRIVRSNPVEELRTLKNQPGGKISVDTVSLLPELAAAGLIDEFQLAVHPIIVGKGRPLLPAGSLVEMLDLELIHTKTFRSGVVGLHYLKRVPKP